MIAAYAAMPLATCPVQAASKYEAGDSAQLVAERREWPKLSVKLVETLRLSTPVYHTMAQSLLLQALPVSQPTHTNSICFCKRVIWLSTHANFQRRPTSSLRIEQP